MKKLRLILFLLFIAFNSSLFGASSESKIVRLIFNSLYPNNSTLLSFTNEAKKEVILKEARLRVTRLCSSSSILYSSSYPDECHNKPLFTDNYKTFKKNPNAIGALYWKKGRPNIIFLKSRLQKFGLSLPSKLKKYELNEL